MALLIPDVGEVAALDMWLSDAAPEAQTLKAYKNDVTPAEGDTAATYTVATIAGYADKAMARASWNAASTAGGVSSKTFPQQTWNFTGTGVVVGYYVIKAVAGTLLWAERVFSSPGQTFNNGDSLAITPKMQLD